MSEPSSSGRPGLAQRLVMDLGAAFAQRAGYAAGHPQVKGAVGRVLASLQAWCAQPGADAISLLVLEGRLVVDQDPVPDDATWSRGLLRAFQRHDIGGLTLAAGLDPDELSRFLDGCVGGPGPAASRHVQVGRVGFTGGEEPERAAEAQAGPDGPGEAAVARAVEGGAAELAGLPGGTVTRIDRLRSLVALLARGAEAVQPDALRRAAAAVNDREFLHGMAVALSTLRLARALGVAGPALEDLVLAGFLHDVGHLEAAAAGEPEPRRRSLHPLRGAARVAALEGVPDVVARVAFEHHLRFDRGPAYPVLATPRTPCAAARVVAVADGWETIHARIPGDRAGALAALRQRAGTFLDPALVDAFAEAAGPGCLPAIAAREPAER